MFALAAFARLLLCPVRGDRQSRSDKNWTVSIAAPLARTAHRSCERPVRHEAPLPATPLREVASAMVHVDRKSKKAPPATNSNRRRVATGGEVAVRGRREIWLTPADRA